MNHNVNLQQLEYLNALEVPVWVCAKRPDVQDLSLFSICLIDATQWEQADCRELFNKIIKALNWPENIFKIVHDVREVLTCRAEHCVVFGNLLGSQNLEHTKVIEVESLPSMLSSGEAKKITWAKLKPFINP